MSRDLTALQLKQAVVGPRRDVRYRVERRHRDGTVTIRALLDLDKCGNELPGYLGYTYRVDPAGLTPFMPKPALRTRTTTTPATLRGSLRKCAAE